MIVKVYFYPSNSFDNEYVGNSDDIYSENLPINDLLKIIGNLSEFNEGSAPNYSAADTKSLESWRKYISNSYYVNLTKNCSLFKPLWNFANLAHFREEVEYSLAYAFMAYRNLSQTLRLFRGIYHPKNVYRVTWSNESAVS